MMRKQIQLSVTVMIVFTVTLLSARPAPGGELTVNDFCFSGPLGSAGAVIEQVGVNHFKVTLGNAPGHTDWPNKLNFKILRNARGYRLRLDVDFHGGDRYSFNEYFQSWSYDGKNWQPIEWEHGPNVDLQSDALLFPEFEQDVVYVGTQVPLSYQQIMEMAAAWKTNPKVQVHTIGVSLGGLPIYRIEITNPESTVPRGARWVHWFANQHPGEHNSQWRMVGMINWLLSDAGADACSRAIWHFILCTSSDAPSNGWYRTNAQGWDMNRSYFPKGSDMAAQPREAWVVQSDLERLMQSDAPVTTVWAVHTWSGNVDVMICGTGPEFGTQCGSWEDLRDVMERMDTDDLVRPLNDRRESPGNATQFNYGPHAQFGITSFLCEGGGGLFTKEDNLKSGVVLAKALTAFYTGTRSSTK